VALFRPAKLYCLNISFFVIYSSFPYVRYITKIETPKYDWTDIWGVTGGSLSLWTGFSVMGFSEILELIVACLFILLGCRKIVLIRNFDVKPPRQVRIVKTFH